MHVVISRKSTNLLLPVFDQNQTCNVRGFYVTWVALMYKQMGESVLKTRMSILIGLAGVLLPLFQNTVFRFVPTVRNTVHSVFL